MLKALKINVKRSLPDTGQSMASALNHASALIGYDKVWIEGVECESTILHRQ
jgi:hypothetical protein